jgi:hypothetical protein
LTRTIARGWEIVTHLPQYIFDRIALQQYMD